MADGQVAFDEELPLVIRIRKTLRLVDVLASEALDRLRVTPTSSW